MQKYDFAVISKSYPYYFPEHYTLSQYVSFTTNARFFDFIQPR